MSNWMLVCKQSHLQSNYGTYTKWRTCWTLSRGSNRTACCCVGARSRLTELLFVCLQNSEIQMWDLWTGWNHGQEMAVVRRASVLTSQQLLQTAPTQNDFSSYYLMHCANLSKTRVWNICLSVCLPGALRYPKQRFSRQLAHGRKKTSVGGVILKRKGEGNVGLRINSVSVSLGPLQIYSEISLLPHRKHTVSSLTWPIRKCYLLKIIAVCSEIRTKHINTEARDCERQTWWCV